MSIFTTTATTTTNISTYDFESVFKKDNLGIYIHVPWCKQKCHYCDFYSVAQDNEFSNEFYYNSYISNIEKEIQTRLNDNTQFKNFTKVNTIFFGGGTPSILPIKYITKILNIINKYFKLEVDCEISLEGNPENITCDYLKNLYDIGINRLNIGIQTFNENFLKKMNRFYTKESYENILENVGNSPITNYGFDLIYGFPFQTFENFKNDLNKILDFLPKHLSIYSLTVEDGTYYATAVKQKKMLYPNENLQIKIWENLNKMLSPKKYNQYEVSNFSISEKYICKHNLRYWLYEPYLGLGPGAHGFDGKVRYGNPKNINLWLNNLNNKYESHDPSLDFPLMFLRISLAWSFEFWVSKLTLLNFSKNKIEDSVKLLENFVKQKKAKTFTKDNKIYFQWEKLGLSFLNDNIIEMQKILI